MTPTNARRQVGNDHAGADSTLAPRPGTVEETGLGEAVLCELLAKHLYTCGVLTVRQLTQRMALPGSIIEALLGFLRQEGRTEVRAPRGAEAGIVYALTDKGRTMALDALMRSGYVGPAPVPIEQYAAVTRAQSVHDLATTREDMRAAFADIVLRGPLLDELGAALNSGRAMFIYGAAGTGKTYITRRLARLLGSTMLIPHAISVNEIVVQVFDPVLHRIAGGRKDATTANDPAQVLLQYGYDPRYARCQRPLVVTGGELTLDMLEIHYDPATKTYEAPLQLKANNGMLMIDDLGRQRVAPDALLNRWIIPMEERLDYLSIGSGVHFSVPFDLVLVFSTNIDPRTLADDAFLRRIGYKIRFEALEPGEYSAIWQQSCAALGVECDPETLQYVIDELHLKRNVPLLPCHPRDLLSIVRDQAIYLGEPMRVTREGLRRAWQSYFVNLESAGQGRRSARVEGEDLPC